GLRSWARAAGVPHEPSAVAQWIAGLYPDRIAERRALLARVGNPAYRPPPIEQPSPRQSYLSGLLPVVAAIPDPPSATPESMMTTTAGPAARAGVRGLWLAVALGATVIGGL